MSYVFISEAVQNVRRERAWDRPALEGHFSLFGFAALRANTTATVGVGDPTDKRRHVMLYSCSGACATPRNELWHEVAWSELTDHELCRAYVLAVSEGWLP